MMMMMISIVLTLLGLTIKDHIKSKKSSQQEQKAITILLKFKEVGDNVVLDFFFQMCSLSDIPLHKINKMRPFLLKL